MRAEELFDYIRIAEEFSIENGVLFWKKRGKGRQAGAPAGSMYSTGYIMITLDYRRLCAHRVAWMLYKGAWPEHQIDHVNGDRTDNREENLRDVTPMQNQANRECHRSGKHIGVRKSAYGMFLASISVNGKTVHLGSFADQISAEKTVDKALEKRKETTKNAAP